MLEVTWKPFLLLLPPKRVRPRSRVSKRSCQRSSVGFGKGGLLGKKGLSSKAHFMEILENHFIDPSDSREPPILWRTQENPTIF